MADEFKPFHETYTETMFSLSLAMMYPNPATDKWRLWSIPLLMITVLPCVILILMDVQRCWRDGEILEVIRHFALMAPFIMGIVKRLLFYYKKGLAKDLLDMLNRDYASYNNYSDDDKRLVRSYIKNTKMYQRVWISFVMIILASFVVTTTLYNVYEHLFRSQPTRHMIYDFRLPNMEPGAELESPYFEIIYAYMLYVALIYVINFTGYDGFMITTVNHACLRIELYCRFVKEAMKYEGTELKRRMVIAINDQAETFKFINMCQSTFNVYLGLMYVAVTTELCVCLYLVTEGYEFDYKFTSFSAGTILHIYVPCEIADKLKYVSEISGTLIYSCGWEHNYDLSVRRYIPFMIARSQSTVALKAFGIVIYEMRLFVSTMKTAYSLYTLIKTKQ